MKKLMIGTLLASSTLLAAGCSAQAESINGTPNAYQMANADKPHKQRTRMGAMQQGNEHGDMKHKAMKHKGMKHGGEMKHHLEELNLTEAQKAQIDTLMQNKHQQRQNEREQMRAQREQMQQSVMALTQAATLDTQALNTLANQEAQRAKARFINKVQTQHAIAQILTPEQRAKLATMQAQRADKEKRGDTAGDNRLDYDD